MPSVLDIARSYVAAGLSVIPIRPDGSKAPDGSVLPEEVDEHGEVRRSWKPFQTRLATDEELVRWFADDRRGIAILCGSASGGLEVLDFDDLAAYEAWAAKLKTKCPGLLERFTIVATPDNGRHVYRKRAGMVGGNEKIAMRPKDDKKWATVAETRGEGGYVLAPGSPAACHPTKQLYVHISGPPLTQIMQPGDLQ